MLVLTRYAHQSVMIGDDVQIVVLDIKGKQVKLGIEAPANVPVHRFEIYQRIQEEKKEIVETLCIKK